MKTIVFGGSGFLGSHVADALSAKGYEVIIFDIVKSKYLQEGQKMILGNILDEHQVREAIKGCTYVYDFAGLANLDDASVRPLDTVMLNVVGTCNILDACVVHRVKRFVYASSFYVNSDKGGFYRCSKQASEIYIDEYARKYNLDYTILRYGSLYGVRADKNNGIKKIIEKAMTDDIIHFSGTQQDTREYIHVADAAELSVEILEDKYINKHLQITGHESYSRSQIIALLEEILNKSLKVVYDEKESELHYKITPYTYKPHTNYKLVSNCYHDFGQGIIECISEIEENVDRY